MWGAYLFGTYPRSEKLIEATRTYAKNLPQLYSEEKIKVIRLQQQASLSFVSEPKQSWDDMLRPFCTDGIKVGGLDRFYENNTFYKKPLITSKVTDARVDILKSIAPDLMPKRRPWKIDLPEPFTFASLAEDHYYRDKHELTLDLADLVAKQARRLVEAGFSFIQLNGPSLPLAKNRDELKYASEGVAKITKGLGAKVYLHTYFEDISAIWDNLLDFKVDGLGVDFTANRVDKLKVTGSLKGLACGLIDARNTRMESVAEIKQSASEIAEELNAKELYLSPSCDLEFLPYVYANRKVRLLGRALDALNGE